MKNVLLIEKRLEESFNITCMEIIDNSALHAKHREAQLSEGKGHFALHIVSDDFADKNLIQRHRLIQTVLQDLYKTSIHALEIKARTPQEFHKQKNKKE